GIWLIEPGGDVFHRQLELIDETVARDAQAHDGPAAAHDLFERLKILGRQRRRAPTAPSAAAATTPAARETRQRSVARKENDVDLVGQRRVEISGMQTHEVEVVLL